MSNIEIQYMKNTRTILDYMHFVVNKLGCVSDV